jgi:hypothetical protein
MLNDFNSLLVQNQQLENIVYSDSCLKKKMYRVFEPFCGFNVGDNIFKIIWI